MLMFATLYVLANSVWFLTIIGLFSGVFSELLLIGLSLAIIVYTNSLWRNVFGLNGYNNGLVIHAAIFSFLFSRLTLTETQTFETWEIILILTYGQVAALFYSGRIFKRVFYNKQLSDFNSTTILVSSGVLCILPLILFLIQSYSIKYVLLNMSFFVILIAYIKSNNFRKIKSVDLPEIQETEELNLQQSKLSLFDWNSNERKLELYKKQLVVYLERNRELQQDAEEKSKIIDQYEIRNENTIESVLLKYDVTPRQLETVMLLVEGKSTKEIADQLFIESASVRCHFSAVYRKTGVVGAKKLRRFILSQVGHK